MAYLRLSGENSEIIVVSDGSCDHTAGLAQSYQGKTPCVRVLQNRKNRGKGASIRRGMAAARGEKILFSDADLSTPIEELKKLEQALRAGADIAIGSRAIPGSVITTHQPWYRELMGKTFNCLLQVLLLPGLHDTQCGFKLFRRSAARKLFARSIIPGFGFDPEILYLARKAHLRIAEVPVAWHNVLESKVSPIKHSLRMLGDLFRIRWQHRRTSF
jgi:dolichyl-phosphate beta-glucosyltransferase